MGFLINTSVVVFPFPNEEQILDLILIYGSSQRDHGFVPVWFEHDVFLPSNSLTFRTRLSSSSRSNHPPNSWHQNDDGAYSNGKSCANSTLSAEIVSTVQLKAPRVLEPQRLPVQEKFNDNAPPQGSSLGLCGKNEAQKMETPVKQFFSGRELADTDTPHKSTSAT